VGLSRSEARDLRAFELYAMREILKGAAARPAAQHASQSEIDALVDLQDAFEAKADAPVEMARLNRAFHEVIVRSARNRYLDSSLRELQDGIALLGATTFTVAGRAATSAEEHRALIAAIAAHDADLAESSARRHIRESLRSRLKLLQDH
jgi:DNA-binding GntR family transcriptional regulator